MATKSKPVIRSGKERGDERRTLIDDRTGIVVDISQNGPDDRPSLYIEVYPYGDSRKHGVEIVPGETSVRRPHPYLLLVPFAKAGCEDDPKTQDGNCLTHPGGVFDGRGTDCDKAVPA